ncbi:LysR substrate-binding domain-containing protein [Nocardia fluminea]|uniref:LysR family transcriptional regulator n=1 Tax=Nocardia fluminea TaxID=134984 RepID=UPI003671C27D
MRVEKIGYFVEVARAGSLRAAAARAGIAQSSLGDQITALEEELNVVLIERTRTGVRLTSAGEELLPYAIRLIDSQRELVDAAAAATGTIAGTVRIGATPMITATTVIPVISALRRLHPNMKVAVREGSSAELERHVQTGAIDFAITTTPAAPEPQGVTRQHLNTLPLAAYTPPGHPLGQAPSVDWATLAHTDLITMREGTTLWHLLHTRIPAPHLVAETESLHSLCLMVEAGIGVGIGVSLGERTFPPSAMTGTWVPIEGESNGIRLHLSRRRGSRLPRAAKLVRDTLAQHPALFTDGPR